MYSFRIKKVLIPFRKKVSRRLLYYICLLKFGAVHVAINNREESIHVWHKKYQYFQYNAILFSTKKNISSTYFLRNSVLSILNHG